jgi:hypothetical protein
MNRKQTTNMMTDFEMTQEQLDALLDSMKPVVMIALQCGQPRSQQQNANDAWQRLGKEMGFDHMTVEPTGRGNRFFKARPTDRAEKITRIATN